MFWFKVLAFFWGLSNAAAHHVWVQQRLDGVVAPHLAPLGVQASPDEDEVQALAVQRRGHSRSAQLQVCEVPGQGWGQVCEVPGNRAG